MDCLFCKIIAGQIPSEKVFEDQNFIAIMDIHPVHPGHILLLPKRHAAGLCDMDDDTSRATLPVLGKLAAGMKKALGIEAFNIIQNNGAEAGQIIFHAHFHLIPRTAGDGISIGMTHRQYDEGELAAYAGRLRAALR